MLFSCWNFLQPQFLCCSARCCGTQSFIENNGWLKVEVRLYAKLPMCFRVLQFDHFVDSFQTQFPSNNYPIFSIKKREHNLQKLTLSTLYSTLLYWPYLCYCSSNELSPQFCA